MISEDIIKPFNPVQAIVVYQKESDYYLESHDLLKNDKGIVWSEGKALTTETLMGLSNSIKSQAFVPLKSKGILPENLLFFQQTFDDVKLVWYNPPQKRTLLFSKKLKLKSVDIMVPGLIFAVSDKDLYLFSYVGTHKPLENEILYKAPFYNINEGASVCMGNIRENKRKAIIQDEMLRWENRFFNSNFTHFLDEEVVDKKYNLSVLYKQLHGTKKQFPTNALIPSPEHKTLNDLLKELNND